MRCRPLPGELVCCGTDAYSVSGRRSVAEAGAAEHRVAGCNGDGHRTSWAARCVCVGVQASLSSDGGIPAPLQPIILNGLLASSISTLLLGLSTSFPMLIAARCLSGALNGNVAIFKSVIGELTDRSNSARAFSFLPLIWALGCTVGSLLGEEIVWLGEQGQCR